MDDNQLLVKWLEKHKEDNLVIRYEWVPVGEYIRLDMIKNKKHVARYIDPMDLMMPLLPAINIILDDMYDEFNQNNTEVTIDK